MRKLLQFPWLIIGAVLALTVFLVFQIPGINLDNDATRFIPENDPSRIAFDELDDTFGSQAMMLVGLEAREGTIFTRERLELIDEVAKKLETIDHVRSTTSLMNTDYIEANGDTITVDELVPEDFDGSPDAIAELKSRALSWDLYHRSIVSDDYRSTQIIIQMDSFSSEPGEEDPKLIVYDGIKEVMDNIDLLGMEYYLAGTPAISALLSQNMGADLRVLIPLVVLIVILTLYLSFRRWVGVILPLVTVVISTIWTIGLMALFNFNLTMIGTIIPVLMIAVGSAYGIHVINHYLDDLNKTKENLDREKNLSLILNAIKKVGTPVLLAGLTTIAGFGALSFTPIIPMRDFGIFTAIGVASALIVALTFLPALLLLFPPKQKTKGAEKAVEKEKKEEKGIHGFMLFLYHNVISKRALTLIVGTVVLAVSGWGLSMIIVDNALVEYFRADTEIAQSDLFLREEFNGTKSFSVVFQSEEKGGMNNPEVLQLMEDLRMELLEKYPDVSKIISYTDMVKRFNQLFNTGESPDGLARLTTEVGDPGFGFDSGNTTGGFGFDDPDTSGGFGFDNEDVAEGFGFDTQDSTEGFGMDSAEDSEGFGFDSGDNSQGFGFDSGDNSQGFGFDSTETGGFGDLGSFGEPAGSQDLDSAFLEASEKTDPLLMAELDRLWEAYVRLDNRLVSLEEVLTEAQVELPIVPGLDNQSLDLQAPYLAYTLVSGRLSNWKGYSYFEIPLEPEKYGWQDTKDLEGVIANYLFLLSSGLDDWADDSLEPSQVRMMIQMNTVGNLLTSEVDAYIKEFAAERLPQGYSISVAGTALVEVALTNLIVGAQGTSILISLVIVFIILAIYFRSLIAGLLGIIPLSVSIMINFGIMGFVGIKLDMSLAMVASIAIGIGIDYTIHFLTSYHHYRVKGEDHKQVTINTLFSSGKAILFNALSVGLGFGVLAFSQFRPLSYMGILIGITMFTASFASMTLLPALLGVIKPKFMTKPWKQEIETTGEEA